MVSRYAIEEESMKDIADAVRWRTGKYGVMSIARMVDEMNKQYAQNRVHSVDICPDDGSWVRPAEWPDLDSLNLEMSGDDFIYMTYDANKDASAIMWHIETANRQSAILDIGHIEDGVYVADETYTVNHNTDFTLWTDDYSGYLVLRITGQISQCYAKSVTRNGQTQHYLQQPILERIAWVPHLIRFCTSYSSNAWTMYTLEREKIANGDGTALTNLYYAWANGRRLKSLDITGIHTPNITDMNGTFYYCLSLKSLNLRHWSVNKVVTFNGTFSTCFGLQSIDLTGWITEKATNFSNMFNSCRSLIEIRGLENFDTSKATTLASMFNECYCLTDFQVEGWNVSSCTTLMDMFSSCYGLYEIDLSGWDVSKVTTISYLFSGCQELKRVCFDGWETGELTSIASVFSGCHNLEQIDISWLHVTNKCTTIYNAFSNCWLLKELDIPNDWDVSGLGNGSNTANSFCFNCYSLERITGIKDWQFYFTNSLASMFQSCYSLRELDVSGWKTDTITSFSNMFQYCYSLEHLDLSGWETDNCTTFASMFSTCWSLKSTGDISGWNTSKVTTFANMFIDCYSLPEFPDMSGWDFSKTTTVASMFSGVRSPKKLTMTNVNLASCTTIATMFRYCSALEKITLTGWSIPKVTSTAPAQFLADCPNLRDVTIDIPFTLNHSYNGDVALSHESLINILNSLPQVSTARTLNLMTQNINRLTAEEKLIATSKGWTLAN